MECKNCSTCCEKYPIDLNDKEYHILKAIKPDLITDDFGKLHIMPFPCVFLKDHRCTIYESRPMVCRTYPLAVKSYTYGFRIGQHGGCPEKQTFQELLIIFQLYIEYASFLKRNPVLLQSGKKKRAHDSKLKKTTEDIGYTFFYPQILNVNKIRK